LSIGVPSVCVGVTRGGNAHRVDEYIQIEPIVTGLRSLLLLLMAAAEHSNDWQHWDAS
jgi:acetylornithine deacetylase/succinyl-diaminopimelate desuccinylase-like protein